MIQITKIVVVVLTAIAISLHLSPTSTLKPSPYVSSTFPNSLLTFGVCFYWISHVLNFFVAYKKITPLDGKAILSQGITPFALVTGGSRGIGYEIAKRLIKKHFSVILVAKNKENLEQSAQLLAKSAPKDVKVLSVAQDLSLQNSARDLYQKVQNLMKEHKGQVEILVNNAGFGYTSPYIDCSFGITRDMINVNVMTVSELSYFYASEMVKRKRGRILHVSSITSASPGPLAAIYSASKSFVASFSQALAYELKDSGVAVLTIFPGATKTHFAETSSASNSLIFVIPGFQTSVNLVADLAAKQILNGTPENVTPGLVNQIMLFALPFFPNDIVLFITKFLWQPRKF